MYYTCWNLVLISGFIKLECETEGRLVNQGTETDPSSGINLELEKLREVLVGAAKLISSLIFIIYL